MKRNKAVFLICTIIILFILVTGVFNSCFGAVDTVNPPTGSKTSDFSKNISKFETTVSNTWGVAKITLQVAAITMFMVVGIKYMFASADAKADLKKSLVVVTIGTLITFGSAIVIDIILRIFTDITGK